MKSLYIAAGLFVLLVTVAIGFLSLNQTSVRPIEGLNTEDIRVAVNFYRASNGGKAVETDPSLQKAAEGAAKKVADANVNSGGSVSFDVNPAGNVPQNYQKAYSFGSKDAAAIVQTWAQNPIYAPIFNGNSINRIGIGITYSKDDVPFVIILVADLPH